MAPVSRPSRGKGRKKNADKGRGTTNERASKRDEKEGVPRTSGSRQIALLWDTALGRRRHVERSPARRFARGRPLRSVDRATPEQPEGGERRRCRRQTTTPATKSVRYQRRVAGKQAAFPCMRDAGCPEYSTAAKEKTLGRVRKLASSLPRTCKARLDAVGNDKRARGRTTAQARNSIIERRRTIRVLSFFGAPKPCQLS